MTHAHDFFQYTRVHGEVLRSVVDIQFLQNILLLMHYELFRQTLTHHQGKYKNSLHYLDFLVNKILSSLITIPFAEFLIFTRISLLF